MPNGASLVLAAVLSAATLSEAQVLPPLPGSTTTPTGTGLIVGQVVDGATGKGVAGALVMLGSRRALTTNDGRFVFRNLGEGSHSLTAAKAGYLEGAFGARRPGAPSLPVALADGERRGDIVVRLWKHGAITGTIVDEAGEPLIGIQVTAMRRVMVGGRRRFQPASTGNTDDRGTFRIARLAPGEYVVAMVSNQVSIPASVDQQYQNSLPAPGDLTRSSVMQSLAQIGA
jgi:hypothetical protein